MKNTSFLFGALLVATLIFGGWHIANADDGTGNSPLYGDTMKEALDELRAPPHKTEDVSTQAVGKNVKAKATTKPCASTNCGVTTCIVETTACQTSTTECGIYTHCVNNNEAGLYCPKKTKWPSTLSTRCPTKKVATVCPIVSTKCPKKNTTCPTDAQKVKTTCPQKRTKCPEIKTQCPKANTSCPPDKTKCVLEDTKCPKQKTVCPVLRTKCPAEATNCPRKKTVCKTSKTLCPKSPTECPRKATKCVGAGTATVCPIKKTQCPIIATVCNAGAVTLCPFVRTACPAGATWCPVVATACPPVPTACVAANTVCPVKATKCPPKPTACPKIPANCPPPPDLINVIINELYWCGSDLSANDQYLELYNASETEIDIGGWEIWMLNEDNEEVLMLTIPTGESITAGGYYLITYYDPKDASSRLLDTLESDLITTDLELRDEDTQYKLIDTNDIIRDVADDGEGFPIAGKEAPYYISMERTPIFKKDGTDKKSWQDSLGESEDYFDAGYTGKGTPGAENSPPK